MPRANYFPKLEKLDTSLYMLGWGGATTDAIFILQPVLATYNGKGDGDYNYGRYSNAEARRAAGEDQGQHEARASGSKRDPRRRCSRTTPRSNHLPLHRQVIPWATRSNVTAVHRADNNVIPYWVTIQ